MRYRTFGRTGLRVSVAGLGTGGASRLGLAKGSTEDQAVAVVHRALELGINYFDSAENYKNEHVLGRALYGVRDEVVISTKIAPRQKDGELLDAAGLRNAVESSLTKLGTDVIDVFHLHRPNLPDYEYSMKELYPELVKLVDEGKIRFTAVSESSDNESSHSMLLRAAEDGCWDVMMTGFNLLNQTARSRLFVITQEKGIAIEIMGAAREPFNRADDFTDEIRRLVKEGVLDPKGVDIDNPLGFITAAGEMAPLASIAYRFVAQEPGVDVVLIGTGDLSHLEENVGYFERGPLPTDVHDRLVDMFGALDLVLKRYSN